MYHIPSSYGSNRLPPYTQNSRLPTTTSKSIKPKDDTQDLDTTRK
ncbi:hypothetical protein FOQG_12883 [Fusarium oxysporum f. sp. raphani 54005]|uniref:Uncharacterized protein n=3 Tax=Fusarium oxysporum TaxID=5507 RepID=X0BV33_FUSOX|nr:hypothetical protein FOVG_14899 [Fusarium oxysporum f. sp. pisi HDV247]EXK82768.1 hypothetical protein FOQG_12883 [Fusarium oxysporum f. sp. raphani 54005]EXL71876.1 hypothetical protein FOPG_12433 [Fusarium oxysporum f. sp. conglutinans race 2 54008]